MAQMMRSAAALLSRRAAPVRLLPASRVRKCFSTEASTEEDGPAYSLRLSDEQTALKELAREFALKEMIPVAAEYDR